MARDRLSPSGLPWPLAWSLPKAAGRPRAAVITVFGVLCLAAGALATGGGPSFDPALAAATTVFGLMCLTAARLTVLARDRAAVRHDGTGVVFPCRAGTGGPASVLYTLGTGTAAGALAFSTTSGTRGDPLLVAIALVFLGVGVVLSARLATGRPRRARRVTLTPAAVVLERKPDPRAVPWRRIREITAQGADNTQFIVLLLSEGEPRDPGLRRFLPHSRIELHAQTLNVDPALLWHALCYYHAHPDARGELSDDRGLHRIIRGDLLSEPGPPRT
ncbi:hypothetical protein GCM10009678_14940 [Actinomadura kijaniata]|uniref:Uncharacterized protein n=1 Tax=Actinomadura namibiensis TaxID=182080 RepID=A0A7W3LQX9_ACTNM|nr:hypothetical protein [Actinomadura namibiensis]MBA8952659.1 hypothetical protein [Actinomadura namibiensis]